MTGLEIALLVFGIFIFITIIIIVILVAVGVFEFNKIKKILDGSFSFYSDTDTSNHVTTSMSVAGKTPIAGDTLVLSNSEKIKCDGYEWTFKDNFLELGTTGLVVVVSDAKDSAPITLAKKTTAGKLNQWDYSDVGLTWCLKSNKKLCIFNKSGILILKNIALTSGFSWVPIAPLVPTACVK